MNPLFIVSFFAFAVAATTGSAFITGTDSVDVILKQHYEKMRTYLSTFEDSFSESNTFGCIKNYIRNELINGLTYLNALKICAQDATASLDHLALENESEREVVLQYLQNVVDYMHKCEFETDAIKLFSCYSDHANATAVALQIVSTVSYNYAASLPALYQQIYSAEAKCNASAEAEFELTSKEINEIFEKCLHGTPETTPASTPDSSPNTSPDTTPNTSETTPNTSETTPNTSPETTPDTTRNSTPNSSPVTTPDTTTADTTPY